MPVVEAFSNLDTIDRVDTSNFWSSIQVTRHTVNLDGAVDIVIESGAAVCLTHGPRLMSGQPRTMQEQPFYRNVPLMNKASYE